MAKKVTLGRTGISVDKNGFGALPIQRVAKEEAVRLLRKAFDNGITFFDTARSYTDSEEKLGTALRGIPRDQYYIATKTPSSDATGFRRDLETSLRLLGTDYIDIYQFHNPSFCPLPGDGTGLFEAMLEARQQGKIRFIGITNHRLSTAHEAVESGRYDTLQFPFCYLATDADLALVEAARRNNLGFLAMKALSGGLITNAAAAYAYLAEFENVLPLWGIQRECELDEFLGFRRTPPVLDEALRKAIETDRKNLQGDFCRACGYCLPCSAGIDIRTCARMSLLIRRSPSGPHLSPESRRKMEKVRECLHCGACTKRCPYHLDIPALLERNYRDYQEILAGKPL